MAASPESVKALVDVIVRYVPPVRRTSLARDLLAVPHHGNESVEQTLRAVALELERRK